MNTKAIRNYRFFYLQNVAFFIPTLHKSFQHNIIFAQKTN